MIRAKFLNKLQYTLKITLIGATLSFLFMNSSAMSSAQFDQAVQKAVDHYLKANGKKHGFTAVEVSVLLPNESTPRNFVAGTMTKDSKIPATTDMLVQYGSITKIFTASLIYKLIEKNTISFDSTLADIFPEKFKKSNGWPAAWKPITIQQLISMTSGIPAYLRNPKIWHKMNPYEPHSKTDLTKLVSNYQKEYGCKKKMGCFKPGSSWFYSNLNYIILGMVVEKYYKMPFNQVMEKNILAPFQAKNAAVYYYLKYPKTIQKKVLPSYFELLEISGNPYVPVGENVYHIPLYYAGSAGSLTGTTAALTQLIRAYFHQEIIDSDIITRKKYVVNTTTGKPIISFKRDCKTFCFGIGNQLKYEKNLGVIWEYEGGTLGFATYYNWFPRSDVVIVISQNSSSDTSDLDVPMHHLYSLVLKYFGADLTDKLTTTHGR